MTTDRIPSIAFHTFGCRLNQAEAAERQHALAMRGFPIVDREHADVFCVHSCAVTEPAVHEIVKFLRAYRQKHPMTPIVLSGCAATLVPDGLADLVVPHAEKDHWLPRVLHLLKVTPPIPQEHSYRPRTRASLIVQDGCDRFCAYCIVPHLRGAPSSIPMRILLQRAEALFAQGYREIVLTGCHLALYHDPETRADFITLLQHLCNSRGDGRFRIGSLEPCILDDTALIRLLATYPDRLCAFLHLPIQTASDTLLKQMGRTYTQVDVRKLLDTLVEHLPFCGLGADWIVGLPGETDTDAAATQMLLSQYPFTGAHIFPYSKRPGTPAATFPNQVSQHLIKARVDALTTVAHHTKQKSLQRFLHRPLIVIPEKRKDNTWEGWSAERLRCRVPVPAQRGALTPFTPNRLLDGIFTS